MWIDGLTLECFSTIAKLQICANYSKLYAFACAYGCVNACVCVCMCVRTRFKCLLKHTCILIGLPLIGPKLEALVNCADILSNIFVGPTWSVHVSWPYIDLGLVWHVYRPDAWNRTVVVKVLTRSDLKKRAVSKSYTVAIETHIRLQLRLGPMSQ